MNSERHQQIYEIFTEAQEMPPEKRAVFLDNACRDDYELRSEVEDYLESSENVGDFIESPALEVAANIIADEQSVSKIGFEINHYRIISLLGVGGMGEVWLAEDVRLKRKVALKLLSAVHQKDLLARFAQEAHAVSALNHPNIITIFDVGQSDGWEYIATEYVEGKTLRQLVSEDSLDTAQSLRFAVQVAAALAAAHSAGIIHRDIKPENIMIRRDEIVKVLDFGLARFSDDNIAALNEKFKTSPGTVMGTVNYMSPEQARGHHVSEKSDVFSLGIVLYEMLSGKLPFEGESGMDVLAAILKYEPQPLDESFSAPLRDIIGQSLEKDSAKRPTAAELLYELRAISRDGEIIVDNENRIVNNNSAKQTIRFAALTDKNSRRKTDHVIASRKPSQSGIFKIACLFMLLAVSVSGFVFYKYGFGKPVAILTKEDSLTLADFENKTGEPDFDDKLLDQSIFTSLRQSPYVKTTAYAEISAKLKEMGKSDTAPLTNETAREISRRLGGKAYLRGSIEKHNEKYLIVFEAVNPETGESLAKEQSEAENKESVVDALDRALTAMRVRLGESAESVSQFSVPIKTAVSSSIPALKLFAQASKAEYEGKHDDAIVLYKRAIEADPDYAIAYYSIASIYSDNGQQKTAKEYLEKAFALRDRLTARDKPELTNFYYSYVTGEVDKEIESYEFTKTKYPQDYTIPINLGISYLTIGDVNHAEENFRTALKISPKMITPRIHLGDSLIRESRFEEAQSVLQEAKTLGAENARTAPGLFTAALALDNQSEMQHQIDSLNETDKTEALMLETNSLLVAGKSDAYIKRVSQAVEQISKETPEVAGTYSAKAALNLAALSDCGRAQTWSKLALEYNREQEVLTNAALVSAICGEKNSLFVDELETRFPQNTIVKYIWLPVIRAAALMKDAPEKALEILETNRQYEAVTAFWGNYLRGKIYLKLNQFDLAEKEFQKIIENRGWAVESPLYVLSYRQMAQAAGKKKDTTKAKKYSMQFAALWKNADHNLPVLNEFSTK